MCRNPFVVVYMKTVGMSGWNSQCVITSSNSSMLFGFISNRLYTIMLFSMFQRLILRSSADKKFSTSDPTHSELMWYSCPFLKYDFHLPSQLSLMTLDLGITSLPFCNSFLHDSYFFSFLNSNRHSLIILSLAVSN